MATQIEREAKILSSVNPHLPTLMNGVQKKSLLHCQLNIALAGRGSQADGSYPRELQPCPRYR